VLVGAGLSLTLDVTSGRLLSANYRGVQLPDGYADETWYETTRFQLSQFGGTLLIVPTLVNQVRGGPWQGQWYVKTGNPLLPHLGNHTDKGDYADLAAAVTGGGTPREVVFPPFPL
jgi:hypothetical protein